MEPSERPERRPKITRRGFLVAGSAAALVAACAPAAAPSPSPTTAAATKAAATAAATTAVSTPGPTLKLGMLLPFTKVYAELGASQKRAAELYLKQAGGKLANRSVQFIFEDEANDPQVGLQKTQKFIEQDQADLMMGIIATPIAYAIRNAVDSAKFIYIGTNAGGNAMTRDTTDCKPTCKSKYVFRTSFSAWQVSQPLGEWLSRTPATKEFFLCFSNYAFGTESAAAFVEGLAKNGGKETGRVAPPLFNSDFVPFVTQIKAQSTKNVYSFFSGTDAIGYIRAWNQLGMPAAGYKMFGAGFLTEQDVLKEVKDQANGAITSLFWSVELDNPENKAFRDLYQKEYNLLPDVFAVQMWDGMKALDEALKKTGGNTKDKDALIAALEGVSFKSPRGDFSFDKATHNVIHDIYIREVKTAGGQTVNTIVDKFGKVTDPGK
ncbi:MAG: ABC transporter substrate-binding protein [Chloroflexi bacterium]|nr:ABC transporter substrate-binding protein [Chloroflexota bacterium]